MPTPDESRNELLAQIRDAVTSAAGIFGLSTPTEVGTVQTTDKSWTTVITHPAQLDITENVGFQVYGEAVSGSGRMSGQLIASVLNTGGSVDIFGETILYRHRRVGSTNFRSVESGANVLFQVRGQDGVTWNWRGIAQARNQEL